jgi:hypothetical protein
MRLECRLRANICLPLPPNGGDPRAMDMPAPEQVRNRVTNSDGKQI